MDFAVSGPLVRRSRLVPGSCPSTRTFAPRFLQTSPRGDRPCVFANPSPPSGWVEDFHLQATEHAQHTTKSLCDSCGCGLALSAVHPFAALSSFWCRFLPCLPASRRRPGGERREPWLCDPSRPIPTERSVAAGNTRSAMLVCSVSAAPPSRGGAGPTAARGVRTSGSGH